MRAHLEDDTLDTCSGAIVLALETVGLLANPFAGRDGGECEGGVSHARLMASGRHLPLLVSNRHVEIVARPVVVPRG